MATCTQHPTIARPLKCIYHDRPPLPMCTSTWNVQKVLDFMENLGESTSLPLKLLSWKTAFLLAITWPSRSVDLCQLDRHRKQCKQDGVAFIPGNLAKQSHWGTPIADFFFLSSPENPKLCPVLTLEEYEENGVSQRWGKQVFHCKHLTTQGSHFQLHCKANLLEAVCMDTSILEAHSVWGASASTDYRMGETTNDI